MTDDASDFGHADDKHDHPEQHDQHLSHEAFNSPDHFHDEGHAAHPYLGEFEPFSDEQQYGHGDPSHLGDHHYVTDTIVHEVTPAEESYFSPDGDHHADSGGDGAHYFQG